ncbi:MAG: M16 family metallopeptidase [Ignavibacteriaceae bacterium]
MKLKCKQNEHFFLFFRRNLSKLFFFFLITGLISFYGFKAQSSNDGNNILRKTLNNGLKVVIVKNDLAPVVTTEINYLVGSNEAPAGFPGTAHALEHMMFRGSEGLSVDQLADITANMGGDFNADTRQTVTQYFFTVPAEDFDIALHIESLRMKSVLSTDSLWENERGAIEQEVAQDLSNPQYIFYSKLLSEIFKGTPYDHDALGTKASFDKTSGDLLKKFHNEWYAPNNAILVIAGNIDPEKTLKEIEDLFGNIPEKKLPGRPEINLSPIQPDTLNLPTDLPYGLAIISFRMPGVDSKDFAAAQILSDVLSSQRGDLYGLVPQGKALYAGFQYSGLPKAGLGFALAVFPKGADSKALTGDVKDVISNYLKNGFNSELVEAAKRHEIANEEFQKNSISGLANVWSEVLAVDGKNSPEEELNEIKNVTVEDVNRVAKEYLDFNHAIFAVLTPQESGKPISQKGFGGSESFAPKNPKAVELPSWASKAIGRLSVPPSVVNPVVSQLPNGIKLIVQPEKVSGSVLVYGGIKNNSNLQTPKNKEGVNGVLARLFEYGTTTLDRVAFQKALDDIAANEHAGSSFSLQVLKEHFDKGLQLLADNLLNPALPEQAFKIVQMQTAQTVAGELKSPDYLMGRAIAKALVPEGDPTLRETTPETIEGVTLGDVKDFYKSVFRPDMTTIVVIGNIDPVEAKAEVEKYFGNWKAEGKKPNILYQPIPLNKPSITAVPDQSRVQDKVTLAQNLKLNRSNPDYYSLQLGNHILGGAFYATKFYKDLRENLGLVYYVSSSFNIGKTRSAYEVSYGCDPPNVSKAKAIIVKDLKEMQNDLVSDKDLKQAKALALREIQLSESSLGGIANGLLARSLEDLPLNQTTIAAEKYIKISAKEIKDAFKKWVRPNDFVQITEGPNPK